MIDFARLEKTIMSDEGFEARPYLDTVGVPTIGYGTTRILGEPVTMETPALSAQSARELLRAGIYGALLDAQAIFSRFDQMDSVRQEVLVNMAYNLGRTRLSGFQKLIRAGDNLAYQRMADEMQDSEWYGQVGYRAIRLMNQMRTGNV